MAWPYNQDPCLGFNEDLEFSGHPENMVVNTGQYKTKFLHSFWKEKANM
jgi:hypothetical protein